VARLEVALVGRLRVSLDGRELSAREVGTRKARVLLQRLAVARGGDVGVGALADAVWPVEQPASPAENLATLVSRLRSRLGSDVVTGNRSGWRLGRQVEVDLDRGAALLAQAEASQGRGEPALVAAAALGAVAALSGDVLLDEPATVWVEDVRAQVCGWLRRARRLAAAASREAGDPATAVAVATDGLLADPFDEAGARELMLAHRAAGEPARSLVVYEQLRRALADELGTDPAPQTRALHIELLTVGAARSPAAARPDTGAQATAPVGRQLEFRRLRQSWAQAASGEPGLIVVTGEPGIGKTWLCDALAVDARLSGATVLSARCYETERSLFLQPLADALRPHLLRSPPARLREVAGDRAGPLRLLVPELGDVLGPSDVERRSPEAERRLTYEAVATVLHRLAARAPVLLYLDDLHNCGVATLEALHLLARTSVGDRLLVLANVRTAEGAATIRRLEPVADLLSLGPLSTAAVHRLAAQAGHRDLADSIARRTRGHPLSVVEMLRAISAGERGVPATLAAAVEARVGRLPVATQQLVRAASVLGASFEPQTLAGLLGAPMSQVLKGCGDHGGRRGEADGFPGNVRG